MVSINNLLIALVFIGAYFAIGLPSDNIFYFSIFFSVIIFFKTKFSKYDYIFAILVFLYVIFDVFLHLSIIKSYTGGIQFLSSIIILISIFRFYVNSNVSILTKYSQYNKLLLIVLFFALLEIAGVTVNISNLYRIYFLGVDPATISIERSRDLIMTHGLFVRPNIFSKEASYAYAFICFLSLCSFTLNSSLKNLSFLSIYNIICFFLYRSPSVALVFIGLISIIIVGPNAKSIFKNKKQQFIFYMILVIVLITTLFLMRDVLLHRILSVDFSDIYAKNSVTIRLVAPIHFIKDILHDYPFFGIGLGNLDFATGIYKIVGNNGVSNLFSFLGILGSIFFITIFSIWLRCNKLTRSDVILAFIFIFILFCQLGGVLTLRIWFYVSIYISMLYLKNSRYSEVK